MSKLKPKYKPQPKPNASLNFLLSYLSFVEIAFMISTSDEFSVQLSHTDNAEKILGDAPIVSFVFPLVRSYSMFRLYLFDRFSQSYGSNDTIATLMTPPWSECASLNFSHGDASLRKELANLDPLSFKTYSVRAKPGSCWIFDGTKPHAGVATVGAAKLYAAYVLDSSLPAIYMRESLAPFHAIHRLRDILSKYFFETRSESIALRLQPVLEIARQKKFSIKVFLQTLVSRIGAYPVLIIKLWSMETANPVRYYDEYKPGTDPFLDVVDILWKHFQTSDLDPSPNLTYKNRQDVIRRLLTSAQCPRSDWKRFGIADQGTRAERRAVRDLKQ